MSGVAGQRGGRTTARKGVYLDALENEFTSRSCAVMPTYHLTRHPTSMSSALEVDNMSGLSTFGWTPEADLGVPWFVSSLIQDEGDVCVQLV